MSRLTCSLSCQCFFVCLLVVVFASPRNLYSQAWYGDLEVSVSPSTPTSLETFDLQAMQTFGDPGQERIEQSITIDGNQIHVHVLMRPLFGFFPQVLWDDGAFFDDIGPLPAGIYNVDAEMWLRRPRQFIGEETVLVNRGSLTFEVAPAGAPLAGDFNEDGIVDAADFVVWRKNLNSDTEAGGADESAFTVSAYNDWRANFGRAAVEANLHADSAAVPEPSAGAAVVISVLCIYVRASRRRG